VSLLPLAAGEGACCRRGTTTRPAVPSPSVATVSRITLSGTATLHGGELCRYDFALQWRADIPVHTRRTGRRRRGAPPIEETHGPFLYLCPAQTIPYSMPAQPDLVARRLRTFAELRYVPEHFFSFLRLARRHVACCAVSISLAE
jgi:hypothetical protein